MQVRPSVEVSGYENLKVQIEAPEPTEDEIQERIDSFLGQFSELASVERSAIAGDTVTMDIATTYQGEDIEGLTANDYSYKVGTGGLVEELDENLSGASIGDELSFDAEHPDPDEDGKLHFEIEIKDIQEQVLPDLDDEVVSNATDFATADEYKADLIEQMTQAKAVQANGMWRDKAAEALGDLVLSLIHI